MSIMKFLDDSSNNDSECEYKVRISSLPQRSIMYKVANNLSQVYEYQGFWFFDSSLRGLMWAKDHFKPPPASTLIASYPKTGTTWLKALTFSIATRNKYDTNNPLQTASPHKCVPFLEYEIPLKASHEYYPQVPLFATHVPYTTLPDSITTCEDCKVVYICRDPTETFVSLWQFNRSLAAPKDFEFLLPIEEGFQQFSEGYSARGPYWEHILGYWRASLENPDKILFLQYEDLKTNTPFYVKKLAEFIGCPISSEEERDGVVERIVKLCSFEHLSGLEVNKTGEHGTAAGVYPVTLLNKTFFRKAKFGDWKNHLPANMKQQMDQIMELKLKDSGLTLKKLPDI